MAGTMPHAIFIETDVDGHGRSAPTRPSSRAAPSSPPPMTRPPAPCRSASAASPLAAGERGARADVPRRQLVRGGARGRRPRERRAAFTLDDLPPTDDEFADVAALAGAGPRGAGRPPSTQPTRSTARGRCSTRSSARTSPPCASSAHAAPELSSDPVDRLYAARDALTDALEAAGPVRTTACGGSFGWRSPTTCGPPRPLRASA